MNLIILNREEIGAQDRVLLDGARARHIERVLKSKVGDALRVGILNGPRGTAQVEQLGGGRVGLCCRFETRDPPRPRIDLVLAMPRPKVAARLWPQISALGVGRIVILKTDKVERSYFDSHVLEPRFYNERLLAGLQQACCTHMPTVSIRTRFNPFVQDELGEMFPDHLRIVSHPRAGKTLFSSFSTPKFVRAASSDSARVLLAVGPEGGWNRYELDQLVRQGFELVRMGPRTLQSDTACLILLSAVAQALEDPSFYT